MGANVSCIIMRNDVLTAVLQDALRLVKESNEYLLFELTQLLVCNRSTAIPGSGPRTIRLDFLSEGPTFQPLIDSISMEKRETSALTLHGARAVERHRYERYQDWCMPSMWFCALTFSSLVRMEKICHTCNTNTPRTS